MSRNASPPPAATAGPSSGSSSPLNTPASPTATAFDRLFQRLSAAFASSSSSSRSSPTSNKPFVSLSSTSARLDDASIDLLFELDRYLSSPAKAECGRYHGQLMRMMVERASARGGDSSVSRQLIAHILLSLMELNSNTLAQCYGDVMALLSQKEQSQRLVGAAAFCLLAVRFGQQFVINQTDVVAQLTRLSKRDELVARECTLQCIQAVYAGTGGPKSTDGNSADLLKLVVRLADKSSERQLRIAAAHTIDCVMLNSADGREIDTLLPICVKALLDTDVEVRYYNADVLGRILWYSTTKDQSRVSEAVRKKRLTYEIRSMGDALELIQKLIAKAPQARLKASLSVCLTRLMQCGGGGVDDSVISAHVMTVIGFVFKTGGSESEREGRQLAACISDAIIGGILGRQSERGCEVIARAIVAALHANHASNELNEYQIMVSCECLSYIFNRLSSAVEHLDIKDSALDVLLFLLASPSHTLRLYAAQTFRCLARAAASHIATWLSVVEKIVAIQLSEVFDGGRGREQAAADPYASLHGHVSALSAVVGVILECEGGVSIGMLDSLFEVAKRLINTDADAQRALTVPAYLLNECGWQLLASLIGLGAEWVAPRLNALFNLWRNVLGRSPPSVQERAEDIAHDLRVRGKALVALRSFVHVMRHRIVVQAAGQFSPVLKATRVFLCTNFSFVKTLQAQRDLPPSIAAALATVKPVLADCFTAIPPASFTSHFSRILTFIVAEFTSPSTSPHATELHRLLNPADHTLLLPPSGEQRLMRFIDLQDDAQYVCVDSRCAAGTVVTDYSWNWCLRPDSHTYAAMQGEESEGRQWREEDDAAEVEGTNRAHNLSYAARNNTDHQQLHAFECYEHTQLRATNACIRLFAAIFADQSATYKEKLMKHMLALTQKAKATGNLSSSTTHNIATALLAVCRDQTQRAQPIGAPNALHTMVQIAVELLAAPSPLVRRAAAEVTGLLVHIEGDEFLGRMTGVLRDALGSRDVNVLCGAVLAYGCVHRYGGGMKTIRALTFTVASLQLVGRDYTELLRLWILHALWLTVETGGLSFSAFAQPTLSIVWSHAMHDCEQRPPLLTLTIGRILHAVIAALGPEVSQPASASASSGLGVERFLNLYRVLQDDAHAMVQVQVVETANQLVLWGAVGDDERLVMLLVSGMQSEEDELRRSCVKCVLRWGEKDAAVISRHAMVSRLIALLDRETSHHVSILIRHAVNTFIKLHCARENSRQQPLAAGERPTRWYLLDTLKRAMVGGQHKLPSDGAAGGAAAGDGGKGGKRAEAKEQKEDDEDEDEGIVSSKPAPDASAASPSTSGADYRWQTKAFALDSLSLLLQTVNPASIPNEFDLVYARRHSVYSTQYMVQQLVDLLTVACMATSSSYDCLRIRGTTAMLHIVRCFGDVVDPDGEGELLLQLYSAQVTSALTASMKNKSDTQGSAPQLRAAACELSVVYLTSGVTSDEVVVGRTCRMLLTPLQRPQDVQMWYAQYDGTMTTMVLLAHLSALCQLHTASANAAAAIGASKKKRRSPKQLALAAIHSVLSPHYAWLSGQYVLALRDYALVMVTAKKDMQRTAGTFFDGAGATRVVDVYEGVWDVLAAAVAQITADGEAEAGGEGEGAVARDGLLMVALMTSTLHMVFAYEILAINRRRPVDGPLSENEKAREQRQVLVGLKALPALLTPQLLLPSTGASTPAPSLDLVAELLPQLHWSLQHRRSAEASIVQPRQAAAVPVLAAVQSLLAQLTEDGGAVGLSGSMVSVAELVGGISELLAVCVYQHLPLPSLAGSPEAGSGPHSPTNAISSAAPSLADAEVYLSPETLSFLSSILRLLPHQATLWINAHQAQRRAQRQEQLGHHQNGVESVDGLSSPLAAPFPFPPSVYLVALVELCLHVVRHGDSTLSSLAATTVKGLVVACTVGQRAYPVSFVPLVSALLSELQHYVGSASLSPHSDHRVAALLQALWTLSSSIGCAQAAAGAVDDLLNDSSAPSINVALLQQVAAVYQTALSSERYRSLTSLLLVDAVFLHDASPAASILLPTTQPAAAYLFASLAPTLVSLLHQTADPAVSSLLARALQAATAALPAATSHALLPVVLPVLVDSLSVNAANLASITALAAQAGPLFRHCVALLPAELRAKLQAEAMAAQGGVAASEADSETAVEDSANKAGKVGKEKKKKSRRNDSGSGTLHAEDAISLSTDFSSFARKK